MKHEEITTLLVVEIQDGYHLCDYCGEVMVNGDTAYYWPAEDRYFHLIDADAKCVVPVREWHDKKYKSPKPYLPAHRCQNIGCCGNAWTRPATEQELTSFGWNPPVRGK